MPMLPIACMGDLTDIPGVPGELVGPPGPFVSITPNVLAGGRPVLTLGATVGPHGNFYDEFHPGYNPLCEASAIAAHVVPNVLVNGMPVAVVGEGVGSIAFCGHFVLGPGMPTVLVGAPANSAATDASNLAQSGAVTSIESPPGV
jgi:uncharacterized Zn-binding protein involved in type VI secretion